MHPQISFPEGAIGGSPRHRPEKEGIDFDDLLDGSGGDVGSHGRTGIDAHDDATVKFECERGSSLGKLHSLILIGITAGRGEVIAAKVGRIGDGGDVEGGGVESEWRGVEASRSNGARGGVVFRGSYGEDVIGYEEVSAKHRVSCGLCCGVVDFVTEADKTVDQSKISLPRGKFVLHWLCYGSPIGFSV